MRTIQSASYPFELSKVFVPLSHDGIKGWVFRFICPGNALSKSHEKLLLLKNATVNHNLRINDICQEWHVDIAYSSVSSDFYVGYYESNGTWVYSSSGKMAEYPPVLPMTGFSMICWEWEIQKAFFESNNIVPNWKDISHGFSSLNETTGQWGGSAKMIKSDQADYSVELLHATEERSRIFTFSPGIKRIPYYFLSKSREELPPTWNLLYLFPKEKRSQICIIELIPKHQS